MGVSGPSLLIESTDSMIHVIMYISSLVCYDKVQVSAHTEDFRSQSLCNFDCRDAKLSYITNL